MYRSPKQSSSIRRKSSNLTRQVQTLVAGLDRPAAAERREHDRVAVPFLLRLTPLDPEGEPLAEEAVTVVGKDISQRGLSFFHERSLPYRRAIIELDHPELGSLSMEVEICWCRFSKLGWYESGGNLMRVVDQAPAAPPTDQSPPAVVPADVAMPTQPYMPTY